MLSTFQALIVAVLALLPGALYMFSYERVVGSYGRGFSDRVIRFFTASAVFHGVLAGAELWLYRRLVITGDLAAGRVNVWIFELLTLLYLALPSAVGLLVGFGKQRNWSWVTPISEPMIVPRAWDYVWSPGIRAVVRLKLKSGSWLAGLYGTAPDGRRSYASGDPEGRDLFLSQTLIVNAETGEFERDDAGRPLPVDNPSSLLIRWEEVEYLEIQEF